jgi:hypothetical protein
MKTRKKSIRVPLIGFERIIFSVVHEKHIYKASEYSQEQLVHDFCFCLI